MQPEKKSEHKNVVRSKNLIKQAFALLLAEKELNKITVTDVVEKAGVSRGTFYAHYFDIYDLYSSLQTSIIDSIDRVITQIGIKNIIADPSVAFHIAMNYLDGHKKEYSSFLLSAEAEKFVNRIIACLEEKFASQVVEIFPAESLSKARTYIIYTLGALKSVIFHWLSGKLDISAEECATYITEFYMSNRPDEIKKLSTEK